MSETDWTQEIADPATDEDGEASPALAFTSLPSFVEDFLLQVCLQHPVEKWCSKWWDHEEAVLRLEALWDAFEAMRTDPGTGTATWIRDFLDPTIASLTSEVTSPFRQCDPRRSAHSVEPRLSAVSPPSGMFAIHGEPANRSGETAPRSTEET